MPAYLESLNPEQRTAVLHGSGGIDLALLLIAGAGTGKTQTLSHRVGHLMSRERILAAFF